ncbi:unnamed protein product [Camellia sinensis]
MDSSRIKKAGLGQATIDNGYEDQIVQIFNPIMGFCICMYMYDFINGYFSELVSEEAGDDDLGDVGTVGTFPAAHTHHHLVRKTMNK